MSRGFPFSRVLNLVRMCSRPMNPPSRLEQQTVSATAALAINEVLEAERMARESMRECDRQAERILRDARERARRIRERAELRIQRCYLTSDRRTAECVRTLHEREQHLRQDEAEVSELPPEWLEVVQFVADELIGRGR